jgi:PIN domain nuclease of toxin-antitoxin system
MLPDLTCKIAQAGFANLPITLAEAERAGGLDLFHRDPFDRVLVAQALEHDLTLLTNDSVLAKFGCRIL